MIDPLEGEMKTRFEQTWATLVSKANPDGLFASAYHIKVAVRDGSGVLALERQLAVVQPAGCAPVRRQSRQAAAGFQRKYNRDYHAIIKNEKLAVDLRVLYQARFRALRRPGRPAPSASPRPTCSCRRRRAPRSRSRSPRRRNCSRRCG